MSRCFLLLILKESDIFAGLFKSRDKPQNRVVENNYTFFMGGTTSGKTVTERSVMQMTAVYFVSAFCRKLSQDCHFIYTKR